ncbi:ATP-dependent dethiobiotin synthetase BioD [Dietzia sp. UCD-THP]|uniref:ATP-dependent dethiobiotin synthetase BioD n=1 Tax=Dietzia sp. UCD-THP TaxID=1292020 RepID=UPI0003775AB0|nr:ATP-dependent dethiobiotin synthetase BioD [Dietzia sp. UCD-THP]EYT65166.1 ATP-dependent dethiobiotin synthetase BioD [Dietzia sp. UCD-THP]
MTAAAAPVVVTGTGTDVGKTIATAALAALGRSAGLDVGICKPVQTGLAPGEPGDADEAARLSGARRVLEVRRLPDPLAPETAARVARMPQATLDELLGPILRWLGGADAGSSEASASAEEPATPTGRLDLIEGAGGVLVRLGTDLTVLDLARSLDAAVVVVARAGLGTLSDTELTVRAIEAGGLRCAGIVIGSWPYDPDLAERLNLEDLPRLTGVPVLGRVPAGAGQLDPAEFTRHAAEWFGVDTIGELRQSRLAAIDC